MTFDAHRHCRLLQASSHSTCPASPSFSSASLAVRVRNSTQGSRVSSSSSLPALLSSTLALLVSSVFVLMMRLLAPMIIRSMHLCTFLNLFCSSSLSVQHSHPYKTVAPTVAVKSRSRCRSGYLLLVSSCLWLEKDAHAADIRWVSYGSPRLWKDSWHPRYLAESMYGSTFTVPPSKGNSVRTFRLNSLAFVSTFVFSG